MWAPSVIHLAEDLRAGGDVITMASYTEELRWRVSNGPPEVNPADLRSREGGPQTQEQVKECTDDSQSSVLNLQSTCPSDVELASFWNEIGETVQQQHLFGPKKVENAMTNW